MKLPFLGRSAPVRGHRSRFALLAVASLATIGFASRASATLQYLVVASSTTNQKANADYVCTGTNDNATIQTAINKLPSTGGTVYLTDGAFNLSAALSLGTATNLKLIGAGPSTVLSVQSPSGSSIDAIDGGAVKNCTLADFAIDGNDASGYGLSFQASTGKGLTVQRVAIYGVSNTTATTTSTICAADITMSYVRFLDCSIHDSGGGIRINNGATNCEVIGCTIYDIGPCTASDVGTIANLSDGISCQGGQCRFVSNIIYTNTDTGINMANEANAGHNSAIDNEVYDNGNSGINTGGAMGDIIIGNTCYANGRQTDAVHTNAGIEVRDRVDGKATSSDIIVHGNRCYEDTTDYPLTQNPANGIWPTGQAYGMQLHETDAGGSPTHVIATDNDLAGYPTSVFIYTYPDGEVYPNGTRTAAPGFAIYRQDVGTGCVFQNNLGDVVKNSGTVTISKGTTSVIVNAGLSTALLAQNIKVTACTNSLGKGTSFWVGSVNSPTGSFTINTATAPGTNGFTFAWQAYVPTEQPVTP